MNSIPAWGQRGLFAFSLVMFLFPIPAQAAISWVANGPEASSTGSSNRVLVVPTIVNNDVLIAHVAIRGTRTITTPANWTLIDQVYVSNSNITQGVYYKIGLATDSGTTATWNFNNNDDNAGVIRAYRGVDTTTPIGNFSVAVGNSATMTATSMDTTVANEWLLAFYSAADGRSSPTSTPTGMVERYDFDNGGGGNGLSLAGDDEARPTVGATGNRVSTSSQSDRYVAQLIALKPGAPAVVTSINRAGASPTSAPTVSWTVIFNKSVTGVDATAFSLAAGGLSGAYISSVTGSGTTWTVTANTGIGSGTLGLNQTGPGSVSPTLTGTFTGQVYTISATPALAEYRMDEAGWNGTAGEVVDTSGSYPGTAMNSANTTDGSRAIPGNPGTCRYGVFDNGGTITQGYVALPGFPNLNTDFTITGWIRSTDITVGAQRILIDDETNTGGYGLSLGEGGTGILRFYARGSSVIILDTPNLIANNTWYFVAGVADISNGIRRIYVFDASGNLLPGMPISVVSTGWGIDAGMASIGGETNASGEPPATNHFKGNIDELRVYPKVLSQSALAALATQSHACAVIVPTPGGFNAYETSTAAGAITGVIRTKTAGNAISIDTIALNTAKTAILTSFTGTVRVEVLDSSNNSVALDGNNCRSTWSTILTLTPDPTFVAGDSGRKTISFTIPNAYRDARVRITYPAGAPTVTGCSTDNFAIRPSSFAVAVTDMDWSTAGTTRTLANTGASGGNVHKAGQPFTVTVTPSPGTATNYDGNPTASALACTLPAVCANGVFSTGAFTGSGTRTSISATYAEAGAFNLTLADQNYASVDAGDGTPADCSATGRYVCQSSAPLAVGRFVPDRFEFASPNTPLLRTFSTASCATRSFTYVGQSFWYNAIMLPSATLKAVNATGGVTTNYAVDLASSKPAINQSYADATAPVTAPLDATATGTPTLSAGAGTGTYTAGAGGQLSYSRSTSAPVNPFNAGISLTVTADDSTDSAVSGNGTVTSPVLLVFNGGGSGIAFDGSDFNAGAGQTGGKTLVYGRLRLGAASGSSLQKLRVPVEAQYRNGTLWISNVKDSCTSLASANIGLGNYVRNPPAGTGTTTVDTVTSPLSSGRGAITLNVPPADVLGVDVAVNLGAVPPGTATADACPYPPGTPFTPAAAAANKSYLRGLWCVPAVPPGTYVKDPSARARFGIRRGSDEIIYLRENY